MRTLSTSIADFDSLPRSSSINQRQLAALLQVSVDTLSRWREDGAPPPPLQRRGRIIRYSVGAVRDFVAGVEVPPLVAAKAAAVRPRKSIDPRSCLSSAEVEALQSCALLSSRLRKHGGSFVSFLAAGSSADEWLFELVGEHERPVSIFESIRLGLGKDDEKPHSFEWISLAAYPSRLSFALATEDAAALQVLPPGTETSGKPVL